MSELDWEGLPSRSRLEDTSRIRQTTGSRRRWTCIYACDNADMPRTIQIRDVDDDVYEALARRAAEVGLSVPEYLRKETERRAARPPIGEWLDRTRRRSGEHTRRDTLEALDELRGAWPT